MLFFRLTLVPIQEGKMEDAMSFAEEKVDEFIGIPGLFPDAAFIPLNVILGVVLTPAWFFAISKAYVS